MTIELNSEEQVILIVDDNPTNLGVIVDYLDEFDFEIITARHGEDGLKKAHYVQPNLILLDVLMPGIDGFETCRRLKADENTKDIPIIFMTALASEDDKVKGFDAGAVDYVTKPIQQREVLARVTTHLHIQKQARKLKEQNNKLKTMTDDLIKSNNTLSKLAIQLETSSQIVQQATSLLNLNELLDTVVKSLQIKFGYYFVSVWLANETNDAVVLQACAGNNEQTILEKGSIFQLDLEHSIIVTAYNTGKDYLANDVETDPNYLFKPELPETCSELALSLQVGNKTIGVLDIQSQQVNSFDQDDKNVLKMLANQITIAIGNAKLYQQQKNLHRLEEEKSQELSKLNADKDKFFSIVAHDLKGPFLPLLTLSQLMADKKQYHEQEEVHQMGETMYQAAQNVYQLLENLLQWSRMKRGLTEHYPMSLDLNHIISQTVKLLSTNANDKNIIIKNLIPQDVFIYADENMMDTIVRNIISNAIKFTPKGGQITISVKLEQSSCKTSSTASKKHVAISITDTGVGIDSEDLSKLFKIGEHHSTIGTEKEQGTGLGLIICQEMVALNGGQMRIESQLNQGTTVTFTTLLHPSTASTILEANDDATNEIIKAQNAVNKRKDELIYPTLKELEILHDLAMTGNMKQIQEHALAIKQLDSKYTLFANKLYDLAKNFDDTTILKLVEGAIEQNKS